MDHFSTWKELDGIQLAFLPIGSLEQHGYHLPVNTDSIIAYALSTELSDQFSPSFIAPTLPYSASIEHSGFPGSISLQMSTMQAVIHDIIDSLELSGIKKFVMINGHGGNHFLRNLTVEINRDEPKLLLTPTRRDWERAYQEAGLSVSISQDMHAGEGETSLLLYLMEEGIVQTDQIIDEEVKERPLLDVLGMKAYTKSGTIGFPTRATTEKGALLFQSLIKSMGQTIEEFLYLDDSDD